MKRVAQKSNEPAKLSPVVARPSAVNAGKTTVGNMAREEPTTIPKMKWYVPE